MERAKRERKFSQTETFGRNAPLSRWPTMAEFGKARK